MSRYSINSGDPISEQTPETIPGYGYGWKILSVDAYGYLHSVSQGAIWKPQEGLSADIEPALGNTSGIYVTSTPVAHDLAGYNNVPGAGGAGARGVQNVTVLAKCQIWGKCVKHQNGYRAQHALPEAVYLQPNPNLPEGAVEKLAMAVRQKYAIDVEIRDYASQFDKAPPPRPQPPRPPVPTHLEELISKSAPVVRSQADWDALMEGIAVGAHPLRAKDDNYVAGSSAYLAHGIIIQGGSLDSPIILTALGKVQSYRNNNGITRSTGNDVPNVLINRQGVATVPAGVSARVTQNGTAILQGGSVDAWGDSVVYAYKGTVNPVQNATIYLLGRQFQEKRNMTWQEYQAEQARSDVIIRRNRAYKGTIVDRTNEHINALVDRHQMGEFDQDPDTKNQVEELLRKHKYISRFAEPGAEEDWTSHTAKADPDHAFIYYMAELRTIPWTDSVRFTDMLQSLFDEFGADFNNALMGIETTDVAAGTVTEEPWEVEHEQLCPLELREEAEKALERRFKKPWEVDQDDADDDAKAEPDDSEAPKIVQIFL